MERAPKYLVTAILILSCGHISFAFEWPVADRVLTATFGESRRDHFHTGIDIGGGEQSVHPVESGEIVFRFQEGEVPGDIPTGYGNFVVIEHARGVRSLYAHLKSGSVIADTHVVTPADVVGIIGDTGASQGKHLHLEFIDSELSRLVNPLKVLPHLSDTVSPTIESVHLDSGKGPLQIVHGMTVEHGSGELMVTVYDRSEYVSYFCPMAPFRIQIYMNGMEKRQVVFEEFGEAPNGVVLLPGGRRAFQEVYHDTWTVRLGEVGFADGETILEIVVTDFAGNESARVLHVNAAASSSNSPNSSPAGES